MTKPKSVRPGLNRRDFLEYTSKTAMLFAAGPMLRGLASANPALDELQSLLGRGPDQLFLQGDATYKNLKNGFNLRTPSNPQAVLMPASTAVIPKIFEWSEKNNIPLHIRSGGHSYEGYSSGSGLVLDLQKLNGIVVDKSTGTGRIQTGGKLYHIAKTLAQQGLMVPAGTCPTVGIAGVTLGGGIGMSSRKLGLTCDNLKSLKAITADGREVIASLDSEPDLFWACRGGGGGNFALVTEFEFKVYPITEVLFFQYKFDPAKAEEVIQAWQEIAPYLPNEITANLNITATSSGMNDIKLTGQYIAKNSAEILSENLVKNTLQPLLAKVSPRPDPRIIKKTYLEAVISFAGGEDEEKAYFKAASDIAMAPLSAEGIKVLLENMRHIPFGVVTIMFDTYRGAIHDVKPEDSAFPHREALYGVQYFSQWGNSIESERRTGLIRKIRDAMKGYFSGRAYLNYIDADVKNPDQVYYAENASRILQIKNNYDPRGFFARK